MVPTLEILTSIKASVILLSALDLRDLFLVTETSTIIDWQTILSNLRKAVSVLPVNHILKIQLTSTVERVAHELYLFIVSEWNIYDACFKGSPDLLKSLAWTKFGTVDEGNTLTLWLPKQKLDGRELILCFYYACFCCAEKEIRYIWNILSPEQQATIGEFEDDPDHSHFLSLYWVFKMQTKSEREFVKELIELDYPYDVNVTLNTNMLAIAIEYGSRSGASYFYEKMGNSEKYYLRREDGEYEINLMLKRTDFDYTKFFIYLLYRPYPISSKNIKMLIGKLEEDDYQALMSLLLDFNYCWSSLIAEIVEKVIFFSPKKLKNIIVTDKVILESVARLLRMSNVRPCSITKVMKELLEL